MPTFQLQAVSSHPLMDGCPPRWASAWGQDGYGPFVEFTFDEITQRLRWIPPGQFLMGSPEHEPGRNAKRESPQHWVEISQGFWIFDTPCTQELWQAVMGDNPSQFKSPQRPVERVSWHDCQQFLERFNACCPDLTLDLPSEAQWEYACRAGTADATYAGPMEILGMNNAPVLDDIAWYGGNSGVDFDLNGKGIEPYWDEKQYEFERCGSRIVATKQPNAWGLYDMLGNVLEWCADGLREYRDRREVDPIGSKQASGNAVRVIRGGSWYDYAQGARSAVRLAFEPGFRYYYLGFRCVRVQ